MSKETDYEKGYNEAFSYIRKKFEEEDVGPEILGFIDSLYKKPTDPVKNNNKPTIYFTTLDKKGNLIADKEKTEYFAAHPDEMETYLANQNSEWREFMEWKKAKKSTTVTPPAKTLVKVTDPIRFQQLFEYLTQGKTKKMMEAENKLTFSEIDEEILKKQTPAYWNALGRQIVDLSSNDRNLVAMYNLCGVDPNDNGAIYKVLKQASEEGFLFDIV